MAINYFHCHCEGSTREYYIHPSDEIRTITVRINLIENCFRNYLPKTIIFYTKHIFIHRMDRLASAVKHHLTCKNTVWNVKMRVVTFVSVNHINDAGIDAKLTTTCISSLVLCLKSAIC